MSTRSGRVVLINTFTPRPGRLQDFLDLQTEAVSTLGGRIDGWQGSRLHRAVDDSRAVMMTAFESIGHHRRWIQSDEFAAHRDKVLALIERADTQYYQIVHQEGSI